MTMSTLYVQKVKRWSVSKKINKTSIDSCYYSVKLTDNDIYKTASVVYLSDCMYFQFVGGGLIQADKIKGLKSLKTKETIMRYFIIINGADSMVVLKESLDEAKQFAVMISDHSEEIIVREITTLRMINNEVTNLLK